jgi:hypothetical protein
MAMNLSLHRRCVTIALALSILILVGIPGLAQPTQVEKTNVGQLATLTTTAASPNSVDTAVKLYDKGQYEQARQLLEQAMHSGKYDAHVCYYAALANRRCGAEPRAGKLFEYILQNFPTSNEARLFQRANPISSSNRISSIASVPTVPTKGKIEIGQHPFTASDIARDGYDGVDQGPAPNCWFESSLAALAALPRGQIMIANLITAGSDDSYVVSFFDGSEFPVSQSELKRYRDHALWAKIIECAERKKFPKDKPDAQALRRYESFGGVAMGIITGRPSEGHDPGTMSEEEIGQFIYAAVKSQNPVIACTKGENARDIRKMLVPGHVYSIIDFETNKNMIVLRNPWGSNPKNLKLENDPLNLAFEEKKDGVIKLSVEQFRKYFLGLRRSFI